MVSNPHISKIYSYYLHSLSTLLPYQERQITSLEDETQFTEVMADLVQRHSNTIPILARGFLECRKYISPADVTRFLDEHLRARIGTRLIAEQHIALHLSSQPYNRTSTNNIEGAPPSYIGVIDTALRPADIVRHCESFVSEICELKYGVRPTLLIQGQPDTRLAYVPTHLEYITTELLKNAFRATVESGNERLPIEVTIAATSETQLLDTAPPEVPEATDSHSLLRRCRNSNAVVGGGGGGGVAPSGDAPGVTIRIRDRGGGISPENLPNIWSYSFTTFGDDDVADVGGNNGNADALNAISTAGAGGSSLAGLGYGLPLGRAYAEYFGGGIEVQSLWGWGTDVYLNLKGLGKI